MVLPALSFGAIDLLAQRLAFFDRYLKGDNKAEVQKDKVRVYISGAANSNANVWLNFSTFPAPGTKQTLLYLHSQGQAHSFPSDGVLNDPSLPTASEAGVFKDRRRTEIRADVLTYTTASLVKPMTILGDITLVLYAASDAIDTDWFAVLTEVFPDG